MDSSDIVVPNICAPKKQRELELAKETNTEAPIIDLKDVSKPYEAMIQYLREIRRCDGVTLSYVAQPTSDLIPI